MKKSSVLFSSVCRSQLVMICAKWLFTNIYCSWQGFYEDLSITGISPDLSTRRPDTSTGTPVPTRNQLLAHPKPFPTWKCSMLRHQKLLLPAAVLELQPQQPASTGRCVTPSERITQPPKLLLLSLHRNSRCSWFNPPRGCQELERGCVAVVLCICCAGKSTFC